MLGIAMILASTAFAQAYTPIAPKPPQITSARTVFLSNNLGAQLADSDKMFDELYVGIQGLNRFDIVSTPAQADVILEFDLLLPPQDARVGFPIVTLRIVDPKTSVVLWSVADTGQIYATMKDKPHKTADVIGELLSYLKIIATHPHTN
jgi:hypothetical protein